jgi:hypothetical protein
MKGRLAIVAMRALCEEPTMITRSPASGVLSSMYVASGSGLSVPPMIKAGQSRFPPRQLDII